MKIDIDNVFDQIIGIQQNNPDVHMWKDVKLHLEAGDEYDISMGYADAYKYLCDCLLMDEEDNGSQKLLDLFLVHQYLCSCYLSKERIGCLAENADDLEAVMAIVRECFSCYRMVGAFQECAAQYEILRESSLWQEFTCKDKMHIMKESAKSYRNIGDFSRALELYNDCLILNPRQDWLQRVELLLKIGKVYRNYLMQIELARFYVEEAYEILEGHRTQAPDEGEKQRYTVICLDTLGQIYRDKQDYVKAEQFFEKSKEIYGGNGGRGRVHQMLLKYMQDSINNASDLAKDIAFLTDVITNLARNPADEIGIGIRSVQLGRLKFKDSRREREEAYREIYKGRDVAYKYNDMKTVIRSYIEEALFLKQEEKYEDYIRVSETAIRLASRNNQLVLENNIIKEIVESSNAKTDIIDSARKIELIKRRKDIYRILVRFSKFSIDIVRKGNADSFSKDKLIDIYGIVLDDFEKIQGELNAIIEILNMEIEKINQKYIAYLNTEIQGFTYKSILHKFVNDLPNEDVINQLRLLCDSVQINRTENREILSEVNKQLGAFANIVAHIKQSARETLQESKHEKQWYSLDKLVRTGIQNFAFYKPGCEKVIQYNQVEKEIGIFVQRTLFETTVSEILNNAFEYVEAVAQERKIEEDVPFIIHLRLVERKTVILECYSEYWDKKAAEQAGNSLKMGLERRTSTKETGSRYGFYSMKLLFEDLLGGKVQILQEEKKAGIFIKLPINLVTVRIEEENVYV